MVPEGLRYTAQHEWVSHTPDPAVVRVGITDFAQDQLGDIVFVQLPEVGAAVQAGQAFGEVESTKSVSEIYAPVSGTVLARNEELVDKPEMINSDPYGEGWLVDIQLASPDDGEWEELLDAGAYAARTEHE
jgi:glycine cleavage system H protein